MDIAYIVLCTHVILRKTVYAIRYLFLWNRLDHPKHQFGRKVETFDLPRLVRNKRTKMAVIMTRHPLGAPTQTLRREGDDQHARLDGIQQFAANQLVGLL